MEFRGPHRENVQTVRRPVRLDFDALSAADVDSQEYGTRLFDSLFSDSRLLDFYRQAMAMTQMEGENLPMRLVIGPNAPELHQLSWERLFDPQQNTFLAMDQGLAFARYLYSSSWRAVERRSGAPRRALLAVANPDNLSDYGLIPIAAEPIKEMILSLQRRMTLKVLDGPVTLPGLLKEVSSGYDIFYLVCHGVVKSGQNLLFLQREDGLFAPIAGKEFVEMMRDLARLPALVVLGGSQTAGLAPMLGEIGVPGVLAMSGNVTISTLDHFSQAFLDELLEHGGVDRAAAVARGVVRDRPDWWVPVLYTRLRDGYLWQKTTY